MAGPLGFLSLGARLAAPIIRGAVWLGRTVLETTRDVLAAGVGALDREIAALHRAELTIKEGTREAISVGETALPDVAGIPEAVTVQRREFSYTIGVTSIDPNTGRPVVRFITISTDNLITPEEAKNRAVELAVEDYHQNRDTLIKVEISSITRAAPGKRL